MIVFRTIKTEWHPSVITNKEDFKSSQRVIRVLKQHPARLCGLGLKSGDLVEYAVEEKGKRIWKYRFKYEK